MPDIEAGRTHMNAISRFALKMRVALAITLVIAAVVAVLTLTPSKHLPRAPGGDKLHHFLAFGAIAFPISFAQPQYLLWIVASVAAYGGLIELIQPWFGRSANFADAVANGLGAMTAGGFAYVLRRCFIRCAT